MISLRFLFWNTHRTATVDNLSALADEHRVDILVLAECHHSPADIARRLSASRSMRYFVPVNLSERLQFVVALSPDRFSSIHDSDGVAIRRVRPPIGPDVLLVALHLPSKLHMSADDHAQLSPRIARIIDDAEDKAGHTRTIVLGDFNMDPFETGVVSSEGFHAVMARSIAARRTRTVRGTSRRLFYNPMWSLLGDNSPPAGTYFYPTSKFIAYFWHMYDQVLLRPELAAHLLPGAVLIADTIAGAPLLTSTGAIATRFSDHLPILATIRMKEEEDNSG
jgi:endonuclease/exonuclease/phosphatase family metal-dependent hydrolase